jgi:SAM-dependent methyltransferase
LLKRFECPRGPAYDLMTAGYDHDRWLDALLEWARGHGLRGRRALDVACGTGRSFVPLLEQGFEVVACDQSQDMRALPVLGSFDLITCIDDSLNHLLTPSDVRDALAAMGRNLAPGGLMVFDVNTIVAYRTAFATADVFEVGEHVFAWRGLGTENAQPGCEAKVQVDVFGPSAADPSLYRRTSSIHRERHYPVAEIEALAVAAGLEIADRRGQSPGVVLHPEIDEGRHSKALFLARKERR